MKLKVGDIVKMNKRRCEELGVHYSPGPLIITAVKTHDYWYYHHASDRHECVYVNDNLASLVHKFRYPGIIFNCTNYVKRNTNLR